MIGSVRRIRRRNRHPTAEEWEKLYAHWRGRNAPALPTEDITRFAIGTAMRLGEILNLQWDDIDRTDRTVLIRDRKHPTKKLGNDQIIPLLVEAWTIALHQAQTAAGIFLYSPQWVSDYWRSSTRACRITELRFHDLRYEGTKRLFEQGYRIEQVALVTGRRDWRNLKRYTNLHARDLNCDA